MSEAKIGRNGQFESLDMALDKAHMRRILSPIVEAAQNETVRIRRLDTEILKQRSKRCVIRYQMELDHPSNSHSTTINLVCKFYRADQLEQGRRTFAHMQSLWQLGFGDQAADGISVPQPLAFIVNLRLLAQEEVPGVPVKELIKQYHSAEHMRQLARTLVKLHSCRLKPGDPFRMEDHIMRFHPKYQVLAHACPHLANDIEFIVDSALAIERDFSLDTFTPIHGDFHMGQVHTQNGRSWLLDLDAFSFGDPAADLGNLIVLLEGKSRRLPNVPALIEAFLDEYSKAMDGDILRRVSLYKATTYLRRACKQLRFQLQGWEERAEEMITRGVACIQE